LLPPKHKYFVFNNTYRDDRGISSYASALCAEDPDSNPPRTVSDFIRSSPLERLWQAIESIFAI